MESQFKKINITPMKHNGTWHKRAWTFVSPMTWMMEVSGKLSSENIREEKWMFSQASGKWVPDLMLEVKDVLRPNDNVIYSMFWWELCPRQSVCCHCLWFYQTMMIVKLQQLGTESTELTLCILTFIIIIIRRKKQVEYNSHEHAFAKISYKSRGLTEDSRLSLSTRNSFICQLQNSLICFSNQTDSCI